MEKILFHLGCWFLIVPVPFVVAFGWNSQTLMHCVCGSILYGAALLMAFLGGLMEDLGIWK